MEVSGILTSNVKIEVNPYEIINQLFLHYFNNKYENIVKKEDGLYSEYDISVHGSPNYEYHLITNSKNLMKIYDGLKLIREAQLSNKV